MQQGCREAEVQGTLQGHNNGSHSTGLVWNVLVSNLGSLAASGKSSQGNEAALARLTTSQDKQGSADLLSSTLTLSG